MAPGNRFCSGKTCHIIITGVALCLLLWGIDSIVDVIVFRDRTLVDHLFAPDPHKLLNFIQASLVLFMLIAYASFLMSKRRQAEAALQQALSTAWEEKAKSESILESLGDAISIQDSTFRIIYQNRTHREMMGDHRGEYCYRAYQQREKVCDDCLLVQAFRDGGTYTREKMGRSLKGVVAVEITVSALKDQQGEIIAGIEAVRDISERKRAEDEIVRLNSDLQRQAEELKAVNCDLEAFSYSVSHDLKAPLSRLCCSADALRSGYSSHFDDNGRFFLDELSRAGKQMHQIIDAMLDLSRVTRAELVFSELDMGHLARSVFLSLSRSQPHRRVEFCSPEGVMVQGDERLLRIALENLIENAWKFTRNREETRIRMGSEARDGETLFSLTDNGEGFDMRDVDRLFKPFQRLHDRNDFPGSGIGLATVQRVIQRHGGRIWAEAVPGEGATFFFTLPGLQQRTDQQSIQAPEYGREGLAEC